MAEMNELLQQAIQECEGLAAEAESFAAAQGAHDRGITAIERALVEQARHAVGSLEDDLVRLRKRDADLDASDEEARARLAAADEQIDDTREKAREVLEQAREGLRELRAQRGRVGGALKAGTDRAREQMEEYRQRLERLEEEAEDRLGRAEDAVEEVEGAVRDAVERFEEAQADVRQQLHDAEDEVRRLADAIVAAHESLHGQAESAVGELAEAVDDGSEQVVHALQDVFGEDLPRALNEGLGEVSARVGELSDVADSGQEDLLVALQAGQAQYVRILETLSSMMKMMHDTQMAVIRNLR